MSSSWLEIGNVTYFGELTGNCKVAFSSILMLFHLSLSLLLGRCFRFSFIVVFQIYNIVGTKKGFCINRENIIYTTLQVADESQNFGGGCQGKKQVVHTLKVAKSFPKSERMKLWRKHSHSTMAYDSLNFLCSE